MKRVLTACKMATLSFAICISVMPGLAAARPKYDRVVTYYDGPNGGTGTVGVFTINCQGSSNLIGERTPYFTVEETLCEAPDPDFCLNWPDELGPCPF